ncbi:hypothetical protein [Streptomyces aquilus]|uniref:hypothetical protein n=1 Tax=Streptomyces aquilus TaxID=2548456 RepID=UPI003685E8F8
MIHSRLLTSPLPRSQVLGSPPRRRTGRRPEPGYRLGRPGHPAEEPTLLIAIFDDSGSVISPAGTDPLSNRYAEATGAFAAVARKGARHELGAILHFDTPCSGDVGPVPITRRGLLTLRPGLRPPPDARGSSELEPSLRRATEMAEAYPGHKATLIVASDFLLMDPEPADVLTELAAFPGQVHAVVLGTRLPAGVLEERITLTRIRRDAPPGAVARALFSSLVVHRPGGCVDQGM